MPITRRKATPELAIYLEKTPTSFSPGDTLVGAVVRTAHIVSTRAWVTIKLYGRAKSELTEDSGDCGPPSIADFKFFSPNDTCQDLFDGPMHIPPEGGRQTWQFALTIPKRQSPRSVKAGHTDNNSYLPLTDDAITASPLPSSFLFNSVDMHGQPNHCYVEYYLEAELRQQSDFSLINATLPIIVQAVPVSSQPQSYNLRTKTIPSHVRTQRLIPDIKDTGLSFRQKIQKFVHSSKVPQFSFDVQVDYPTIIKIQNTAPIPFMIRVIPDHNKTSEVVGPQTVTLVSLRMNLISATSMIHTGNLTSTGAIGKIDHYFAPKDTVLGIHGPITIPSDPDSKALDIGALLQLSLDTRCARTGDRAWPRFSQVFPDFVTYNIKHSHSLRWELHLEVAGEIIKATGQYHVTILPII